jgi:excisionase family DNA binding protein
MTEEPFVSAEEAAEFLSVKRRYLLALARKGIAGAYALGTGTKRKIWVFRLSELAAEIISKKQPTSVIPNGANRGMIRSGSPR